MAYDTVVVLTSKSIETMATEGGSGNWRANRDRLKHCKWLVAVRNGHSNWNQGNEEHGTAFVVGRVAGVKDSPKEEPGRLVIVFDAYAELSQPDSWPKGYRNPVRYTSLEEFNLDPTKLKWRELKKKTAKEGPTKHTKSDLKLPLTVLEKAKLMIAESLSLSPSAITISIQL